ncbi:MAG: DNA polymerase III subunit chi [Pseudomonadota bacterium]
MAELGFYRLTETPLERALPVMLAKSLERGWRVEVRGRNAAALEALDQALWSHDQESFLPHGLAGGSHDARQPVLLTTTPAAAGGKREALFLIDRAGFDAGEAAGRTRTALLFDGHDEEALAEARDHWRATVAAGLRAIFWAQAQGGRWEKQAESGG